jgi:predicted Zn finger-like uncharacterized protein
MIVSCPECGTRYLIDGAAIGNGRRVRCARCAHVWLARPTGGAAPAMPGAPAATAAAAPESRVTPRFQLPAVPKPRRSPWLIAGWGGLAAVVALLVGILFFGREALTTRWPAAERLYAVLGLGAEAPEAGLDLLQIKPGYATENGETNLVITGEIANRSRRPRDVPPLKAVLKDKADQEVQSWTFTASQPRIEPGQTVAFRTATSKFDKSAVAVSVVFADGG